MLCIIIMIVAYSFYINIFKKDNLYNQDGLENVKSKIIYNPTPVLWKKAIYKCELLPQKNIFNQELQNVFIIDNNEIMQKTYFNLLRNEYNLFFFRDAKELIDFFKNEKERPDLMIASETIPVYSGIYLYKAIYSNESILPFLTGCPFLLCSEKNIHFLEEFNEVFTKENIFVKDFLKIVIHRNIKQKTK